MRWFLAALAVLAVTALTIWLVGRSLPVAHRAEVSRTIDAPLDSTWARIATVDSWPDWRDDVRAVEHDGTDTYVVTDDQGSVRYRVHRPEPYKLVTTIDQDGLPWGGSWTWTATARGSDSTSVTIVENGEVYNPVFRFLSRFVFGHESSMETALDQLEDESHS